MNGHRGRSRRLTKRSRAYARTAQREMMIKGGDTFSTIARANGTTPAAIAAVNPSVDSSKLKVGQKIKLPAKK